MGPPTAPRVSLPLHAALDAGITLLDTGDFYGMGHNELLIREALAAAAKRDKLLLSVKFGALRDPAQNWSGYDARPAAVKNFLAYSLQRLGVDYIDIYRPARLDPHVPIEETVGAIGDMIKAGYVRYVGLSEVGAATLRRAQAAHPICDLQIEYSLASRGIEAQILPVCRELGIGITAYGVLSRGLISGHWSRERAAAEKGFRQSQPALSGREPGEESRAGRAVAELWRRRSGRRWRRSRSPGLLRRVRTSCRLIGAKRRAQLTEALGALDLKLTAASSPRWRVLCRRMRWRGARYMDAQMEQLDSEKR